MADIPDYMRGFDLDQDYGFTPVDKKPVEEKVVVGENKETTLELAKVKSREINKKIKLGICGEHGGDPNSVRFCNKIGLDYVSCSPYRLPIAKLAAAQAVIDDFSK